MTPIISHGNTNTLPFCYQIKPRKFSSEQKVGKDYCDHNKDINTSTLYQQFYQHEAKVGSEFRNDAPIKPMVNCNK